MTRQPAQRHSPRHPHWIIQSPLQLLKLLFLHAPPPVLLMSRLYPGSGEWFIIDFYLISSSQILPLWNSGRWRNHPPSNSPNEYSYQMHWCQREYPIEWHPGPSVCTTVSLCYAITYLLFNRFDCNGTGAQKWLISKGNTQVKLAGTNFCLDAGSSEFRFPPVKFSVPLTQITLQIRPILWPWKYGNASPDLCNSLGSLQTTRESPLLIGVRLYFFLLLAWVKLDVDWVGLCLDVINGNLSNSLPLQTFQCTDNDQNQVFTS